jgi:hypothetical protein
MNGGISYDPGRRVFDRAACRWVRPAGQSWDYLWVVTNIYFARSDFWRILRDGAGP